MKNKIKVMNKRHEITDEELEGFKNFDALLTKHKTAASGNYWLKVALGAISILLLVSVIYYFSSPSKPVSVQIPVEFPDTQSKQSENLVLLDTPEEADLRKENQSKIKSIEKERSQFKNGKQDKQVENIAPLYVQAEPIEGYTNLYEYFNRELVYPPNAVMDSVQGVLIVSFTINKQGTVENIHFTNTLGKLFEEEAIRLIQQMPAWRPATVNGSPVPSKMSLPLTFQIQKQKN